MMCFSIHHASSLCTSLPHVLPHSIVAAGLSLPSFPVFHVPLNGGQWVAGLLSNLIAGQAVIHI